MHFTEDNIENYLLGKLQGNALQEFERALQSNKELREEVAFKRQVMEAIKASRKSDLKNYIQEHSDSEIKTIPLINRNLTRGLAIAASVVLVAGVIYFLIPNESIQKINVFKSKAKFNSNTTDNEAIAATEKKDSNVEVPAATAPLQTSKEDTNQNDLSDASTLDIYKGNSKESNSDWDYSLDENKNNNEHTNADEEHMNTGSGNENNDGKSVSSLDSVRHDVLLYDTVCNVAEVGQNFASSKSAPVATVTKRKTDTEKVKPNENTLSRSLKKEETENIIKVEYWESAIHYKGYRFFRNNLKLYGLNKTEKIQIYLIDGNY